MARKRTTALMAGIELILSEHTAPLDIIHLCHSQVHKYLDIYSDEEAWVTHAKSLLTYPLSRYLNNEPPPAPSGGYFRPTGNLKRWMKCRQMRFNSRNTHLWYSWLQAKRSCLPASPAAVESAYLKHAAKLSSEDSGDEVVIDRIMSNPTFIRHLQEVQAGITLEYFRGEPSTTYRPSLRSSLTHSRAEGGAITRLRSGMSLYSTPTGFIMEPDQLMSMSYERVLSARDGRTTTKLTVREQRCYDESLMEQWEASVDPNYYLNKSIEPSCPPLQCKITGIIEPLKVRIISRGPANEYYLCKKLQSAMHTTMRSMPAYRLIGGPLKGGDTMSLRRPDGTQWFSIDYSAATDNLSYKYSKRIADFIWSGLGERTRALASRVLGLHDLEYPDGSHVQMRRGQLMGSILSFPVLCLANMGVYLDVTKEYQSDWNYYDRTSSVWINGDDQLYAAPPILWGTHAAVSNAVGLELSIGKAYIHPTYLNINSQSVHHAYGSTPKHIDYLNTGLFFGQSKVMKTLDESSTSVKDTTTNLNRLLSGSLPGRQHILLAKFLKLIGQDNLDKEKTRYYYRRQFMGDRVKMVQGSHMKVRRSFVQDLFLPISQGGCGVLRPLRFVTRRAKRIQKRVAFGCIARIPNPSTLPRTAPEYIESQVLHTPVYSLEAIDTPCRTVFPYQSGNGYWDPNLELVPCRFKASHAPTQLPCVQPPVRDYLI
jgi:hypothetical protein